MNDKRKITPEIIQTIKSEIDRTQISAQRLLRGQKDAKDMGLTSGIIYSWLKKSTKTARSNHVDLALKLWDGLPDADYAVTLNKSHQKDDLQPISKETHIKLKKIQKLTGLLPSRIFKLRDDAPMYLNSNIVGQWLYHKGL